LVVELGRADTVGHPMRYGVSFDFLQYFGLKSTHELPSVQNLETLPINDNEKTTVDEVDTVAEIPNGLMESNTVSSPESIL
jgi:hypothetical protein